MIEIAAKLLTSPSRQCNPRPCSLPLCGQQEWRVCTHHMPKRTKKTKNTKHKTSVNSKSKRVTDRQPSVAKPFSLKCKYCQGLHSSSKCPINVSKRTKKLQKASAKRAKKLRRQFRQVDNKTNQEEKECLKNLSVRIQGTVPGAVPVFDFNSIAN